jgi:hypothetical protein
MSEPSREPSIPTGPATADRYRWMAWGGVRALIELDSLNHAPSRPPREMPREFEWVASEEFALSVIRAAARGKPGDRVGTALDLIRATLKVLSASWPMPKDGAP